MSFLHIEGVRLQAIVGAWFGVLFWAVGAFSLFASSMGIIDYTSRLAADVLKRRICGVDRSPRAGSISAWCGGWSALGCVILLVGLDQPLVLLVISACVGGTMMCLYSPCFLLNERALPPAIGVRSYAPSTLVWSTLFFGALAALTIWQQASRLLGWD